MPHKPIRVFPGENNLARHAHRVPIYSINGGAKPMLYVSRKEAETLEACGHVRRISRLKDPKLVMRFRSLQRQPRTASSSITCTEMELNALAQVLRAESNEEKIRARRIAEKIATWPSVGDEKAARAGTKAKLP